MASGSARVYCDVLYRNKIEPMSFSKVQLTVYLNSSKTIQWVSHENVTDKQIDGVTVEFIVWIMPYRHTYSILINFLPIIQEQSIILSLII